MTHPPRPSDFQDGHTAPLTPGQRARVLIEALPYLRQFTGRTIVVKYGGNAMTREELKEQVMQDIALLHTVGIHPILVHGGGPEIDEMMKRLGHEPAFVDGLRVTDSSTMEIVEMVLAGKTNKAITSILNRQGAPAVGLSGKDADLLVARKRVTSSGDLGFVGDIVRVNASLLKLLANEGYIPVVCSVAAGENGESYNVNADHAAGAIAAEMKAAKLVVLTDVTGVYADPADESTLISEMDLDEARALIAAGKASRGMIPKLQACISAVEGGVERAHLIDGRIPHALLIELFTNAGIGTMIRPAKQV